MNAAPVPPPQQRLDVLVTGATGFVGSRLVPRLLAAGHRVRCLVRDPSRLDTPWRDQVEVVAGRVEDQQAVWRAGDGCDAAYFLVHGLGGGVRDLLDRERRQAAAFATGAETAGIEHIVYLGGLVDEDALVDTSDHLYARHQTGVELRQGPVPVTEVRVGIVLGNGSASFELLVAGSSLPVRPVTSWTASLTQPIATADLVAVLVALLDDRHAGDRILEIGGPDVLTYGQLGELVREELGLPAGRALRVPYLPPEAVAPGAAALSAVDLPVALTLLQSARVDAVVREPADARYRAMTATSAREAIRSAVAER